MVRYLNLKLEDFEFKANLAAFSRDSSYGRQSYEKRGEDGTVYRTVFLIGTVAFLSFQTLRVQMFLTKKGDTLKRRFL